MSIFSYSRRPTTTIRVGHVEIGSQHPLRLQSMNNTDTADVEASAAQAQSIAQTGADIDRLTAQGVKQAQAMGEIRSLLRSRGCNIPLVADIHFNPRAAYAAAELVDKVRINPGNFVDPGRVFKKIDFTDEEYARELAKIDDAFGPFLDICAKHNTAVRIGVNHGSLSDRIMSRYGDTPAGMVESAMEFLRVAVRHNFNDIVISIKASNTVVMVETVRLLVQAMDAEDMHFPLHLGVTEAGDGEDGRIRSAVGIGTLLAEGIGDTIRVSLSEAPEAEIPVARELAEYITSRAAMPPIDGKYYTGYNPIASTPRPSAPIGNVGGQNAPVVLGYDTIDAPLVEIDAATPAHEVTTLLGANPGTVALISSHHPNTVGEIAAMAHALTEAGIANPIIAQLRYDGIDAEKVQIRAGADFGLLLLNGLVEGIDLQASELTDEDRYRIALGILQASRRRISRTEFVSCPGCGRTLFDLITTVQRVKAATSHLKGLKIAVMGCIVNGPGEMADADYGYVGAAAGHVSLYRGKQPVEKNIPTEQALDRLIQLLKDDGRWVNPS